LENLIIGPFPGMPVSPSPNRAAESAHPSHSQSGAIDPIFEIRAAGERLFNGRPATPTGVGRLRLIGQGEEGKRLLGDHSA